MKIRHVLTIAVALSAMAAAPALAWVARSGSASYSRTYTSPTGRSWESSGGGGSASGERSVTTPYGETYSSSGSATYGGGSAYGERTVTTPYGGSYSAYGRYYRPPGW